MTQPGASTFRHDEHTPNSGARHAASASSRKQGVQGLDVRSRSSVRPSATCVRAALSPSTPRGRETVHGLAGKVARGEWTLARPKCDWITGRLRKVLSAT